MKPYNISPDHRIKGGAYDEVRRQAAAFLIDRVYSLGHDLQLTRQLGWSIRHEFNTRTGSEAQPQPDASRT